MPQHHSILNPTAQPFGLVARGKWLQDKVGQRVLWNGVTYGPFPPNQDNEPWPNADQLKADFLLLRQLRVNVIRVYELPTKAVIDLAREHHIGLLVTLPWVQHIDFLEKQNFRQRLVNELISQAEQFQKTPEIAGVLVGNEIESSLVRWMGPEKVRSFLEEVIAGVKAILPNTLVSYTTYPSTEYLIPRNADFVAFNVFLETPEALKGYLQRLQVLAEGRPLVITEFGLDSLRHGEEAQARCKAWSNDAFRAAEVAGQFWFSFTDEWHRGGKLVTDWAFGLVDAERRPKAAFHVPYSNWPEVPIHEDLRISVVVCTRNGTATLRSCLEALQRQRYANFEVWIIDDGSTEPIEAIAKDFPAFHYRRQEHAGLSVARNLGMELATGEIVAYTDDDCLPDENWLVHIAAAYDSPEWVAAGGPNLPPPPRNHVEACVALAPGAPAHVLLNDREAEHLPGCNLTIRKSALQAIGGFKPHFMVAGDDVDLCWRLQAAGGKLRFVPSAVVWHHRRFTVKAYFRQQRGYGHAESMLIRDYPERFAWFSGAHWRGIIYGDEFIHAPLSLQQIHYGELGSAPFQCIYSGTSLGSSSLFIGLPWVGTCTLLLILALITHSPILVTFAVLGWLLWSLSTYYRHYQIYTEITDLALKHRLLLLMMQITQPIVRDYARTKGLIRFGCTPLAKIPWSLYFKHWKNKGVLFKHRTLYQLWSEKGSDRSVLIDRLIQKASASPLQITPSSAWEASDLYVAGFDLSRKLYTVSEYHGDGKVLTKLRFAHKIAYWKLLLLLLIPVVLYQLNLQVGEWLAIGSILVGFFIYTWKNLRFYRSFKKLLHASVQDTDLQHISTSPPSS